MLGFSAIAETPVAATPQAETGIYTLAAASGGFTLTGSAASLKGLRRITAAGGAYSITGSAAALRRIYTLAAATGSFTLTGTAASPRGLRRITTAGGAYSITGSTAALKRALRLAAGPGDFTWTGEAANLVHVPYTPPQVYTLSAESGAIMVTGTPAILIGPSSAPIAAAGGARRRRITFPYFEPATPKPPRAARRLVCEPGRFEISGGAAKLERRYATEYLLLLLAA